ncbi:hypothetical protein [Rahnella woolbedingensis]|uniref:hypothetical protein n=1 Tax=Rahnella woolbedingensis TaxID=1510574 RepID=UPI001ABFE56C|nr:hypothetical protein [Rahnella woolbedingensis]
MKWRRFPSETVQSIFTAVEEDDTINPEVSLQDEVINLQCSQDAIWSCYSLCLQFWEEGFTREGLLRLINKVLKGGELTESERMQYKYIRARYKHLRFAQRLYSKKHESHLLFRQTTVYLGHFQDAFRNGKKSNIRYYGNILRLFLSAPAWTIVRYALRHTELDNEKGFLSYRQDQIRKLQCLLSTTELTGKAFHDVRKIISQHVSYFDTARSIDPADINAHQVSQFLANINGLMGDKHDDMVADKLAGRKPYDEPSILDDNIRQPLELFLARYPL